MATNTGIHTKTFPVVCVGGSAGGLDAYTRLLRHLPCDMGVAIVIVNHFSGSGFWWLLERLVKPLASRIGFRSDFSFAEHIESHDWRVRSVKAVNFLGLSKIVTITNP